MRFQTGALKQGRNTDSQAARIGGTRCGSGAIAAPGWCDAITVVESRWNPRRKSPCHPPRHSPAERFILCRHDRSDHPTHRELLVVGRVQLVAERRNRGYTLYRAGSGTPIARLRLIGQNDRVECIYWSLWKERWTSAGPFGRTILPIDDALHFIASEDIFWAAG